MPGSVFILHLNNLYFWDQFYPILPSTLNPPDVAYLCDLRHWTFAPGLFEAPAVTDGARHFGVHLPTANKNRSLYVIYIDHIMT